MDVEVFDRGRPISEARLRADRHHLLAPGLSLFTRVPYLKDSDELFDPLGLDHDSVASRLDHEPHETLAAFELDLGGIEAALSA